PARLDGRHDARRVVAADSLRPRSDQGSRRCGSRSGARSAKRRRKGKAVRRLVRLLRASGRAQGEQERLRGIGAERCLRRRASEAERASSASDGCDRERARERQAAGGGESERADVAVRSAGRRARYGKGGEGWGLPESRAVGWTRDAREG